MVKTIEHKNDMSAASKQYKKVIKQNLLKYKRRCKSKIADMRTSDPKCYWNYMNSINKKTTSNTADMHILFDFFKDLNPEKDYGNEEIEADFPDLMNTVNTRNVLKLCKFISIILYHVKNPPD